MGASFFRKRHCVLNTRLIIVQLEREAALSAQEKAKKTTSQGKVRKQLVTRRIWLSHFTSVARASSDCTKEQRTFGQASRMERQKTSHCV